MQELQQANVAFEEITEPKELSSGLALGRYASVEAAEAALAQFNQVGVRAARVLPLTAPQTVNWLRLEQAEPALAAQARSLQLAPLGGGFGTCTDRTPG